MGTEVTRSQKLFRFNIAFLRILPLLYLGANAVSNTVSALQGPFLFYHP